MISIKRLLSALCWVTCSLSFSVFAQQVDTTGNLINNNNWSGVGAYAPDPNDCCSNPGGSQPLYDTATGTIKWSYGQATVQQGWAVNQALQGTGLQVHGYNYQYDLRNMNGDGNQNGIDTMVVNTWLKNSAGQVVLGNSTVYSTQFDWTTIGNTMTLNSPMPTSDLGTAGISFASRDGGFWAGLYGPEVRNVSFSLNYSFDPCAADPLYSSSCPGYWEAWFAQFCLFWCPASEPEPEIEVASVDYSLTPSTTSSTSIPEETTTGEVKVDAGGIEVTSTGELQVPDGIPEEAREKKPVDMNLISKIVREATDESATMAIVNQSIEQSMDENANPDFSMTNETLASISRQTENSIQQSILENAEINMQQNESSQQTFETQQTNVEIPQQSVVSIIFDAQNVSTEVTNLPQNMIQEQTETYEFQIETKIETSELQNQSLPRVMPENNTEITQTVKKDVKDNDAAGDVKIDDLANSPIDFNAYLNQQMVDAQFYASKDIYRGQVNVDNARALRGLGTDRLHREMVEQQYNRGVK